MYMVLQKKVCVRSVRLFYDKGDKLLKENLVTQYPSWRLFGDGCVFLICKVFAVNLALGFSLFFF